MRRLTLEANDSGKPRLSCTGHVVVVINASNFHVQLNPTTRHYNDQQVSMHARAAIIGGREDASPKILLGDTKASVPQQLLVKNTLFLSSDTF